MKELIGRFIRSVTVILMGSCCPLLYAAAPVTQTVFEAKIANIDKWIVDLTSDLRLLESKEFIAIYKNPMVYYGNVIVLLGKPKVKEAHKAIAVLAMQRLPRKEYLLFLNMLLGMLEKGKISYLVFEAGASPGFDWNTTLQENYNDPDVRAYLIKAKASSKVTQECKDIIDRILSGQAAQDVEEWRDSELNINPKYLN